jgi:hypothetical protein
LLKLCFAKTVNVTNHVKEQLLEHSSTLLSAKHELTHLSRAHG